MFEFFFGGGDGLIDENVIIGQTYIFFLMLSLLYPSFPLERCLVFAPCVCVIQRVLCLPFLSYLIFVPIFFLRHSFINISNLFFYYDSFNCFEFQPLMANGVTISS